jgi:hypothetical protein
MRLRLPLLVAVATLLLSTFSLASNCNQTVVDNAHVLLNPTIVANAAQPLINQGADVHVITVGHDLFVKQGSTLAGVESYIESSCPSWTTNGTRKANLFVVLVAPTDRQKNIFLGSYYNGAFNIPVTYSQAANSYFKAGQWEQGLASTLNATTSTSIAFQRQHFAAQQRAAVAPPVRAYTSTSPTPTYTTPQTQTADSSGVSGFTIFLIVVVILLLVAAVLYFLFRESETTTTTSTVNDTGYGPRTSYTPAARSYGAAAPSHTTVINNPGSSSGDGFVTGLVVGEMLNRPNYQPPAQPVYVAPPTYVEPTPSYTPDPTPVADAPDSTWSEPTQSADTDFGSSNNDTPSFDPPSSDFGSSNNDSGF